MCFYRALPNLPLCLRPPSRQNSKHPWLLHTMKHSKQTLGVSYGNS
jgi:hypothetical protein